MIAGTSLHVCHGQDHTGNDKSYALYLTQVAAAEALLHLNKISSAHNYLSACDEQYRDVEWHFLKANLDQSARSVRKQPGDSFTSVAISPDGRILAAAGSDSSISLYTYPGLKLTRELRGHKGSVSTLAFSSNGKRLASGGRDHSVIIWDVERGTQLSRNDRAFTQGIYQVRFSARDSVLGVVSWERLKDRKPGVFGFAKLLDGDDARELRRIELDNHPAAGIVFTPDGLNMIVSSWGEIVYSYDIKTGAQNWTFDLSDPAEYNAFHSIDISPDGSTVALGSADHRVYLLSAKEGRVIHRIEPWNGHTKTVKAVCFSPDGASLATAGEDQTILVWNTGDLSGKRSLVGHVNTVSGLAWARDGKAVVSSSLDGGIREWDLDHPFETTYDICNFGPWQTPFTSDRKYFAAPCSDEKLLLYEASTGRVFADLGAQSGLCADISEDSRYLATASFDGVVRVWDIRQTKEIRTFQGHTARVDGIAYLTSTNRIVSVGDTTLRVWQLNAGKETHISSFNTTPFRIIASPDEAFAYIGFTDGRVDKLDTGTWSVVGTFRCTTGIQEMTISPDGRLLALFSGKDIEVWDAKTLTRKTILGGHEKAGYGIGFSADGRYLISGSYDQTFKLWNLARGACTLTYHGYEEVIYSSAFLSSNEICLSSSQGHVRYYRFKSL
jgi:WD40 repeat protein